MSVEPLKSLSMNYFLEMNSAREKSAVAPSCSKPNFVVNARRSQLVSMMSSSNQPSTITLQSRSSPGWFANGQINQRSFCFSVCDENMGNFPLRMLVIIVKVFKVLEHKKLLVQSLAVMNAEAEKMQMLTSAYPITFKVREQLRKQSTIRRSLLEIIRRYFTRVGGGQQAARVVHARNRRVQRFARRQSFGAADLRSTQSAAQNAARAGVSARIALQRDPR